MLDEARAGAEITEDAKHMNKMATDYSNLKMWRRTHSRGINRVNKLERKVFRGHEFELKFTSSNKNKAKREAQKYHRRGFDLPPIVVPHLLSRRKGGFDPHPKTVPVKIREFGFSWPPWI